MVGDTARLSVGVGPGEGVAVLRPERYPFGKLRSVREGGLQVVAAAFVHCVSDIVVAFCRTDADRLAYLGVP